MILILAASKLGFLFNAIDFHLAVRWHWAVRVNAVKSNNLLTEYWQNEGKTFKFIERTYSHQINHCQWVLIKEEMRYI